MCMLLINKWLDIHFYDYQSHYYFLISRLTTQLVNRKADFLQNESILIDSHNESNRFDSNRELECSSDFVI